MDVQSPNENSRRDLLRKGAVAGGIVWAAPMLLSSPASAQSTTGSPPPEEACTTFYYVMLDAHFENCSGVVANSNPRAGQCFTEGNTFYTAGRTYGSGCATIISADAATRTVVLGATLGNAPGGAPVQQVEAGTKGGTVCGAASVTRNADGTYTIVFPASTEGGALSNVAMAFCAGSAAVQNATSGAGTEETTTSTTEATTTTTTSTTAPTSTTTSTSTSTTVAPTTTTSTTIKEKNK